MAPEVLEFGDVRVDLRRLSVSRAGQPVSLEPKTFDVLRYLLEHRDRLVTKEELLDVVWKDTFVTPNVLTRAIAQLRKGLGDDAFEAKYVETAAKRGYRFIAVVTPGLVPSAGVSGRAVEPSDGLPALLPAAVGFRWPGRAVLAFTALLFAAIGIAVYAVSSRDREPAAPVAAPLAGSLRRFTIGSQSYSFPSISSDGRTVAYSSDETGTMEIYTAGFAPGSTHTALTSDGGQNTQPEWSPDGQWIAYHSRKKGGIWIVPSGGGTARQVVDFGSQPAWMPDGQRIVFTASAGGMAAQSVLWSVDRDGRQRRQLTKLGAPKGGHTAPVVSPDGRRVAFAVSRGLVSKEIWMASMDGRNLAKLGAGNFPRFSLRGDAVYWLGSTESGDSNTLIRVRIGERGAPVGEPEMIQSFSGNFAGRVSIARDGNAIVWLYQASSNLWAVDVPASRTATAPPKALTSDDVRNSSPAYSSDGRVAYHQISVGQPQTSWIVREDGGGRELLTVGLKVGVWGPQWTPDNKRLFVTTASPATKPEYAWLDVATRQLSTIMPADGGLNPRLSPDGKQIAFHVIDEGGVLNVWTQALGGGPKKQVTFDSEAMSYPAWSPDGKTLAVEIKRGDHTHIGVVPVGGGPVEPLVTGPGQSWPHSWAPDNDRIAFAGERDGVWNIYTVSRSTKDIRQLTNFTSVEDSVRYPSWSPTRPMIAFVRAEQRGSLWTLKLP